MSHGGRRPGAGRPKGARNKRTIEVEETLARLGCNPIEGLAWIAMNDMEALEVTEPVPLQLRAKAYTDLAQYVVPKRKAVSVEHNQEDSTEKERRYENTEIWLEKTLREIEDQERV